MGDVKILHNKIKILYNENLLESKIQIFQQKKDLDFPVTYVPVEMGVCGFLVFISLTLQGELDCKKPSQTSLCSQLFYKHLWHHVLFRTALATVNILYLFMELFNYLFLMTLSSVRGPWVCSTFIASPVLGREQA